MPKKRIIQKRAALVPLEFCLYEIVFAKQKGYPAWPAVITEFHPQKQRCAKVEFFAWDKQWAYISFNNLMKLQAGRSIVEKHSNNAQFQRAVNEMEFCLNMANRISMGRSNQTHSPIGAGDTMQPNSAEPTVALVHQKESVPNKKTTKSEEPKPVIQIKTRSKNRFNGFPINDGDGLQPSSTDRNNSFQPVNRVRTRSQNSGPNGLTNADGALHPNSTELTVLTVGQSSSSIQNKKRRREPNDQTLSNLGTVHRIQTRSQKFKKL